MKSEPKSELKDMDDSDTKLEKKPDKACINDCAPNEQCCVCSGQCNLEPEDQALLKSLDALVGCENNCKVEVRFFGYLGTRMVYKDRSARNHFKYFKPNLWFFLVVACRLRSRSKLYECRMETFRDILLFIMRK